MNMTSQSSPKPSGIGLYSKMAVTGWVTSVLASEIERCLRFGDSYHGGRAVALLWDQAMVSWMVVPILWSTAYLARMISRKAKRSMFAFSFIYIVSLPLWVILATIPDHLPPRVPESEGDFYRLFVHSAVAFLSTATPLFLFRNKLTGVAIDEASKHD
jgi:hypothetical protein